MVVLSFFLFSKIKIKESINVDVMELKTKSNTMYIIRNVKHTKALGLKGLGQRDTKKCGYNPKKLGFLTFYASLDRPS